MPSEQPYETPDSEPVNHLYFEFSLPVYPISSRTDGDDEIWSDSYPTLPETDWEETVRSFAVYVYSSSGEYVGRFADFINLSGDKYSARLVKNNGEFARMEEFQGSTLRFHVFVNSIPEPTSTEEGLFAIPPVQWYKDGGGYTQSYMPMWGMKEAEVSWEKIPGMDSTKPFDIGQINILRTLAKVEIVLMNEDDEFDYLDSVTIGGMSVKTFCHVPGYATSDERYAVMDVKDTNQLTTYQASFKTVFQNTADPITFRPLPGHEKQIVFYVPEQTNDSGVNEVKMIIKAGGQSFDEVPLKFREYGPDGKLVDGGEAFNIIRNHYYRYELTITKGHIKIDVKKWECQFNNNFHF